MSPPTNKVLEVKMNRTLFICGNYNGHHNTELKTQIGGDRYIDNIRTLSENIKFICTSFINRKKSESLEIFFWSFHSESK